MAYWIPLPALFRYAAGERVALFGTAIKRTTVPVTDNYNPVKKIKWQFGENNQHGLSPEETADILILMQYRLG
ncbi:hypothetical protein [Chitinophaga nivalis]|uniref:Uncharacterized protein n=1 Tax=Chitinophaga nivalis TaxID=2991709 RepID=A0ABT3IL29_9BACT|nr:hypothetical protein [Chitinophaga nivalis]MCW3465676.1 hypothetical protein [Chitinophaga nivalis]MCW3484633.1 hypothetical protein [Chitinophaga nivalis]